MAIMQSNLTEPKLSEYLDNPKEMDWVVRYALGIPDDKYYSVSVWPVAGRVALNGLNREVKSKKVSKSDQ